MKKGLSFFTILFVLSVSAGVFASDGLLVKSWSITGGGYARTMVPDDHGFELVVGCRTDTGAVDIAFVIDTTGSMYDDIADVRDNLYDFTDELDAAGYDYQLGMCTFGDGVNSSHGGWGFTSNPVTFHSWIAALSSGGGADWEETSLDAIADAIRNFPWRAGALHIVIMITDAPYCVTNYSPNPGGCCCETNTDETDSGVYSLVLSTGTVLFIVSPYSSGSPSIPAYCYNWYHDTAHDSGGNWYVLGTSFSIIFSDIADMISEFQIINIEIENVSGVTLSPVNAQLLPRSCVTITYGSNPQVWPSAPPGGIMDFSWRVDVSCSGSEDCFQVVVWSGSYADTIMGCMHLGEDCECYGPVATVSEPIPCGVISACDYQSLGYQLTDDDSPINASTISLEVDGHTYIYPENMTFSASGLTGTVTYTPAVAWTHGQVVHFNIWTAEDGNGCPLQNHPECSFTIDLLPPDMSDFSIPCGSIITDSFLTISVDLQDYPAGIDIDNLYFVINGDNYPLRSGFVTYVGDEHIGTVTFSRRLEDMGIEPEDTILVCLHRQDLVSPEFCGPNEADSCCEYYVNVGPTAYIVHPMPDSITACDPEQIIIHIHDAHGIDPTSIQLLVDTTIYTMETSRWLQLIGDSLIVFSPPAGFYHTWDTIHVELISANDSWGAPLQDTLIWDFYVDYAPPVFYNMTPPESTIIFLPTTDIYINVFDSIAGVDSSSLVMTVNGEEVEPEIILDRDGSWRLHYLPTDPLCPPDSGGCTVEVCVYAGDLPDYCGPNDTTFCWTFDIILSGPVPEIVTPQPESTTACLDQPIIMYLHPTVQPVDPNSIHITIDGIGYTVDSTYLTFTDDSVLTFQPPAGFWDDFDTVLVSLDSLRDIVGTPADSLPVEWVFYTDFSPPIYLDEFPPDGAIVASATPTIAVTIFDSITGLDTTSFVVVINDTLEFVIGDTGVYWDSGRIEISSRTAGFEFSDSEYVEVCIRHAWDRPDYCEPNSSDFCWDFFVSLSGPDPEIISYLPYTYVACDEDSQYIEMTIIDPDTVDPASVVISVEGERYTLDYPGLTYENDTLVFHPLEAWENNQIVDICLLEAVDLLGNPMPDTLCWSFIMDLEPPVPTGETPAGVILNDSLAAFSILLYDTLSGIDDSSIVVYIDSIPYTLDSAGIHWDGETLSFSPEEAGIFWSDWDTVNICISVEDLPDYCGPNDTTYCWRFFVHLRGPVAEIVTPLPGQIAACDSQEIVIHITDDDTLIDPTTILLVVEGDTFSVDGRILVFDGENLTFYPLEAGTPWYNEQEVNIELISADDMLGNHLQTPLSWSFLVDLEPPVVIDVDPAVGDTVSTITPVVRFHLTDNLSGVDIFSLHISADTIMLSPTISSPDEEILVDPVELGIVLHGGDSLIVCVSVDDSPDICLPANHLDTCWTIYIEPGGPVAEIIRPFDGAYSACQDTEHIEMTITDENGVNPSTILFQIVRTDFPDDTLILTVDSAGVSYDGTNFSYYPELPFSDGEEVFPCLLGASDMLGNPMDSVPICWHFIMDLSPPVVHSVSPTPGDTVATRLPVISFYLNDYITAVDLGEFYLTVNGVEYMVGGSGLVYSGDTVFSWYPESLGIIFSGGDSIVVCLHAQDNPDYCDPNMLDTCWTIYIEPGGPVAEILRPFDGAHSSCEDEHIVISLTDSNGVNDSTIILVVNGDSIDIFDPRLTYSEDTLIFIPAPYFSDTETVYVELIAADDILANPLETPLSWMFIMDRIPPAIEIISPADGEVVPSTHPTIRATVDEEISWLNYDSLTITVNGITYTLGSAGVTFAGDTLIFSSLDAGVSFIGGDTVDVCITAYDSLDYCDPNDSTLCWEFYISPGGPVGHLVRPIPDVYSACVDEHIEMTITDEDSVVDETIRLLVARYGCTDTVIYDVSDPQLDFSYPNLIFIPDPPFADAETICVTLIEADDTLGNHLTAPVPTVFYIDLTPPVITSQTPYPGIYVDDITPEICVGIADYLSGLDPATISITIDGTGYSVTDEPVSFDGELLCFDPTTAGLEWHGGDTVSVCVHSEDSPYYCDPNVLDSCWQFYISPGGPIGIIVRPQPDIFSACIDEHIIMTITDTNGVDESTIRLVVEGVEYSVDDVITIFRNDTLYHTPPTLPTFADAETVDVCLTRADDMLGNPLSGAPICWSFVMDLSAPYVSGVYPAIGNYVASRQPEIHFGLFDDITGVSDTSIIVTVDGIEYRTDDPALSFSNDTIYFDPVIAGRIWSGGDSIVVCVYAHDRPTPGYCDPNELDTCWVFYISPGGPVAEIVRPFDGAFSACEDEHIVMTIRDADGVDEPTIRLVVEGTEYAIDGVQTIYQNDTLYFFPEPPFANGQVVDVCLTRADDMLGNPLTDAPVCWSFTMDLTPPFIQLREPENGIMTRSTTQRIHLFIQDTISGLNVSGIELELNGEEYDFGDLSPVPNADSSGFVLTFEPASFGVEFGFGDTIRFTLSGFDTPDYCAPNDTSSSWWFWVEPQVSCLVFPNPFTPNGDGYNEMAVFNYPFMFSEEAHISVYTVRNLLVWEKDVPPLTDFGDYLSRAWNGCDLSGKPLPEGLYIYVVQVNDEVVCNGTVVIAR